MRLIRVINSAALILLFGTLVPVYAQHEQLGERQGKAEKQRGKPEQGAPAQAQSQRPQQQQGARGEQRQNQPQERRAQPPARQQQQQRSGRVNPQEQQAQRGSKTRISGKSEPHNPIDRSSGGPNTLNISKSSAREKPTGTPGNNSSRSSILDSRQWRGNSSGDGYSKAAAGKDMTHGSKVVLSSGTGIIALGFSAEVMADTSYPATDSISALGVNIGSECTTARQCIWVIPGSSTAGTHSC